jgi:hypothetical protein
MDRVRFTLKLATLITSGFAIGCGGASEAGPRLKRTQPIHELKVTPESAANTPASGPKKIPVAIDPTEALIR